MQASPLVSIIMGSTSDLPIMEKAAARLDALGIPFEMLASLSCDESLIVVSAEQTFYGRQR